MKRLLLVLLLSSAVACQRPTTNSAGSPPSPTPGETSSDGYPSKEELLTYLEGKSMPLVVGQSDAKPADSIVLHREQIEALSVSQGGYSVNGGPWNTSVTFLVNTEKGKYAVVADVQHRRVENKRAFFGLNFKEVARQ